MTGEGEDFTSISVDDTSDTSDTGDTGEPEGLCADPEFGAEVPDNPLISECSGQGGGALVFDIFSGFGNGVVPDVSSVNPTVVFPDDDNDKHVDACCGDDADPEFVEEACVSDCGRAACNIAIATLEDAVADPTSLEGNGCGNDCAMRAASSLEDWVLPQLKSRIGYDACVTMAGLNNDPSLDYTLPDEDYEGEQLSFQRPDDSCMMFGCMNRVRLRIFCGVDSVTPTVQMCTMAGNEEHPDIPDSGRLIIESGPTEITTGPKGNTQMFFATSEGGTLSQDICNDPSCLFVLESFALSTDEDVDIGPLHAWNLTAILDSAAVGTRVGNTVTFGTGALRFRITGSSSVGNNGQGKGNGNVLNIEFPLEFAIANTSPATATFTGATFAFDNLVFSQGQDEFRVRTHDAQTAELQ